MITPPTDNLYKFMAIFGLTIVFSSAAFWWNASNKHDEFFESNLEYINGIFEGGEAYKKYAEKVNEGIAIHNSVHGDQTRLSQEQLQQLDTIFISAEILGAEAQRLIDSNPAKRIAMSNRSEKYHMARFISLMGIGLGILISAFGFYLWHTRVQKYIDQLHEHKI